MNNYLFLGLFLGVAITAGVVMFMLTPKDDITYPGISGTTSGVQENLKQMYNKGLIDRAGNPINKTNSTPLGNLTLPPPPKIPVNWQVQIPNLLAPFGRANAAFLYDLAVEEQKYEPWAYRR